MLTRAAFSAWVRSIPRELVPRASRNGRPNVIARTRTPPVIFHAATDSCASGGDRRRGRGLHRGCQPATVEAAAVQRSSLLDRRDRGAQLGGRAPRPEVRRQFERATSCARRRRYSLRQRFASFVFGRPPRCGPGIRGGPIIDRLRSMLRSNVDRCNPPAASFRKRRRVDQLARRIVPTIHKLADHWLKPVDEKQYTAHATAVRRCACSWSATIELDRAGKVDRADPTAAGR